MKKSFGAHTGVTLMLVITILFSITTKAYAATTTLIVGQTLGARETISDNNFIYNDSQSLSNFYINLTYINHIEVSLDYQRGENHFYSSVRDIEYSNFKFGYPVWDLPNLVVFATAGSINYNRQSFSQYEGFMLGADITYIATSNLYLDLDAQYSILGATYRRQYPGFVELPMDQICLKLKAQYILNDNLGVVVNLHWLHFNANSGYITEDILMPSLGMIYRF